ncbi:hypothetical protein NP493_1366g00013 [Ridgeia piscesae]|uniref:Uncharacterized protein n=1 Tax=Ridgeia piscesae TaxID=27915 RepID=A0AAD9K631_RIDPI|nr:hypothetical protein NP493_1366g00013 [Ridgeia piscesae]
MNDLKTDSGDWALRSVIHIDWTAMTLVELSAGGHANFIISNLFFSAGILSWKVLVAVKNFSNYKDDNKSHAKLIQSNVRGHDQVKVIFDTDTKVSSLKESTPCRGNSKGIRSNIGVANVCRSAYYHLSRIVKIRDSISTTVCKSLIHGLVTSRLDYGNAILYGISDRHMHRLEMVQRSAARIVRQIRRGDRQSMTTILRQLHWLPVRKRIDFKLLVLVHRAIYNGTPEYLAALLRRHTPPRSLRSAGGLLLEVPRVNLERFGRRAFACALCGTNFQGTYVTTATLHSSRSN